MDIEKLAEEAAGAFAADKGLGALDPNAGLLAKAAAAVAGGEGVSALTDLLSPGPGQNVPADPASDGAVNDNNS